ncbi:histidine phosphatase family protein [Streptomyces paludis]|uniref:Histidine phosphatase family protein n=1 Tax=Streptomyces paludis TaxID=2282738 RepID=A0A345HIU3_9ACTN|nr:histidine phosphatase family protein [Streptomyces paludis]AXG76617.1 histidine phosphatase family protein [Streptomyces paludis]
MRLHLVRHARTEYNAAGRLQGWCDSPLAADGLGQLRATAAHLAGVGLTAAWASPSGRTMTTAREILRHHDGLRLRADDGLREYAFGALDGHPESELFGQVDPREFFADVIEGRHPGLPGGEPAADYLARVAGAFERVVRAHPDGEVLVVAHGITLVTYLTLLGSTGVIPLANCSVSTVEITGSRAEIVRVGFVPAEPAVPAARTAL